MRTGSAIPAYSPGDLDEPAVSSAGEGGTHLSLADSEALPFPVPAVVVQARKDTPWASFLPAHAGTARWVLARGVKRGLDMVLALAGLILLSPLLLFLAVIVKLTSPGPVFFEWRVLGRHARPFRGWKFRTMVVNADELKSEMLAFNEMTGPAFKMRNDPRVTPAGRWMRKYSLDELPQLWSVLVGDMSLVGPRPPGPSEFAEFEDWQRGKLAVTPGITCIWQVSGRSEIRDFNEWVRMDLEYIRNWSLGLDLRILARTLPAVIQGRGAY